MCTSTDLVLILLEDFRLHLGVMQQAQSIVANVDKAVEPSFLDADTQRDCAHHLNVQLLATLEEVQHMVFEDLAFFIKSIWPIVVVLRIRVKADLVRLIQSSAET